MIYIRNDSLDPHFNLAAEEYTLETFPGDVFMLWRNSRSVILGKNQNAYSEINLDFARESGIKIVRRLTGGGCVFHDPGNVNFTYITDHDKSKVLNFEYFTLPVISALKSLGVEARLEGRNDLLIGNEKFSGNAQCVYKTKSGQTRIMHHGTILYSADMSSLAEVLKPDEDKIISKSVKSVRSRVTNVADHLPEDRRMPVVEFFGYLEKFIAGGSDCVRHTLTEEDNDNIEALAVSKYRTSEFLYGSNIAYEFRKKKRFSFGGIEVCFFVREGKLTDVKIHGDFFGERDISELERKFEGAYHNAEAIIAVAESVGTNDYISGSKPEDIAELLL
ncbi:lipoate--protein ligase [Clostridia bacterium]|nr:lipoate--protein ligase [Clostridia bacterium]